MTIRDLRSKAQKHSVPKRNQSSKAITQGFSIFRHIWSFFGRIFGFFFAVFRSLFYWIEHRVGRVFFVQSVFMLIIVTILYNFWFIFSAGAESQNNNFLSSLKIQPAQRGTIYYRSIKFDKNIALTTSQIQSTITFNPSYLATNTRNNVIKLEDVVFALSANLNIPYKEVESVIQTAVNQDRPAQYAVLKRSATEAQGEAVARLQASRDKLRYSLWLQYEPFESRTYTEGKLSGNILGYMKRFKSIRDDAYATPQCRAMIENNEKRSTVDSFSGRKEDGVYTVGVYGLEQKFCSELGGLNGREQLFSENRNSQDGLVVDGADLYLTIDSTLQAKAQEILNAAIENTTFQNKTPRNGSILIMNLEDYGDMKAGEVLAMASWPQADSNNYDRESYIENGGFQNVNVSDSYEIGSVMKPITVASSLNEWFSDSKNKLGERLGIAPDWRFSSNNANEKVYTEPNGQTYIIRNVEKLPNQVSMEPKECLYRSTNTCLTEIETRISNSEQELANNKYFRHDRSEEYFSNRYGFGRSTLMDLPPSSAGDISNFKEFTENTFQYANFSFGQGFKATPAQLARAYSAIARTDGTMIEPHIVKSIKYDDGRVEEATTTSNPRIATGRPVSTLNPQTSQHLNDWLKYAQDGYGRESAARGEASGSRGFVDGYPMAGKTGTAQVSRPETDPIKNNKCGPSVSNYDCNSTFGITDQTFVQFGPVGAKYEKKYPKILVIFKLSEPLPGVTTNFALLNIGPFIEQVSRFTLEYLGVPPNLGY